MNEHDRIDVLRRIYGREGHDSGPVLGIGDDAAIVSPVRVLSTDAAVDGAHFRSSWVGDGASWHDIGWRATVAALSDLAAMGAEPAGVLSSLILPREMADDALFELAAGVDAAARAHQTCVVGGNLARGSELSITTTVAGTVEPELAFRRDSARPGDSLYLSGPVGAASLGLSALDWGAWRNERAKPFVDAFLRPRARIELGRKLLGQARCAIDVSDGLIADIDHLCRASDLVATLDLSVIPRRTDHDLFAMSVRRDPAQAVLAGGDDYELVLASPRELPGCIRIGSFERPVHSAESTGGFWMPESRSDSFPPGAQSSSRVRIVDEDGREWKAETGGFDHFRG